MTETRKNFTDTAHELAKNLANQVPNEVPAGALATLALWNLIEVCSSHTYLSLINTLALTGFAVRQYGVDNSKELLVTIGQKASKMYGHGMSMFEDKNQPAEPAATNDNDAALETVKEPTRSTPVTRSRK